MKLLFTVFLIFTLLGCEREIKTADTNSTSKSIEKKTPPKPPVLSIVDEATLPHRKVYTKSIEDIFNIFNAIGYGEKKWYDQSQIIPRIYLQRISCRWKNQSSNMNTETKKDIFFKLITPAILRANELIQIDRERLLLLSKRTVDVNSSDYRWLRSQIKKYKIVQNKDDFDIKKEHIDELLKRMDIIPPSLALAQAANESGWATSRFASEGNALFGQWTFGKNSMIPKQQRSELGNYGLAKFKTPQDSVNSYMLNLNSNNAYKKLRDKRYALKKASKKITGLALCDTLDKYSERGKEYVESLKQMIRHNHLAHFDTARLWRKEVILIVPRKIAKSKKVPSDCNSTIKVPLSREP
jgi:uncharacterized FlgJ-related protein